MKNIGCEPPDYRAPDFCKVAQAYGIPAVTISGGDVPTQLAALMMGEGPFVCDVVHNDFCTYEPRMSRWECRTTRTRRR